MNVRLSNIQYFTEDAFTHVCSFLPEEENQRLWRFKHKEDRYRSALGKFLLFQEYSKHCSSTSFQLQRTNYGKPYLQNWCEFNISHSGDYVVLAYGDYGEVGIDVEKHETIDIEPILDHFHESEIFCIQESPKSLHDFYRIWTKKEALLKASGKGLVNELDSLSCLDDTVTFEGTEYYLMELDVLDGYSVYVAANKPINSINWLEVKIPELTMK